MVIESLHPFAWLNVTSQSPTRLGVNVTANVPVASVGPPWAPPGPEGGCMVTLIGVFGAKPVPVTVTCSPNAMLVEVAVTSQIATPARALGVATTTRAAVAMATAAHALTRLSLPRPLRRVPSAIG